MSLSPARREFLTSLASAGAGLSLGGLAMTDASAQPANGDCPLFKISVAQYSLHRLIAAGKLDPRDYGPFCKKQFDVDAVEYWMGPYHDKARDPDYMGEMHSKSVDAGVKELLIMVDIPDGEGDLGHPDPAKRTKAIESHYPWVEVAKRMGCHSIRVNARSEGTRQEQAKLAAEGLRRLSEFAGPYGINVIVENHGGLSSDGSWLADVISRVNVLNCGTLPDFGNFRLEGDNWYDRYQGVKELMPFAKAVSAKSHEFDDTGNEVRTDYHRMMKIVLEADYHGYVGIEWEGSQPESEVEGVLLTKRLLERVCEDLAGKSS